MKLLDTKNIIEIIYKYKTPSTGIREFYIEGEDVKKFLQRLGSASFISVPHGITFQPLNWKVRRIEKAKQGK